MQQEIYLLLQSSFIPAAFHHNISDSDSEKWN